MATGSSRETRVQAYNPSSNSDGVFQLAELGAIEPKLYVHMIEVFSLPADANKEQVLSNLTQGLSRTLAEYPILTGTLHFDNEAKRIAAKKGPSSSVALHVKEAGPGSDIESFSFLEKHDFPVHLLDASKVLPPNVVGVFPVPGQDLSSEGPPISAFQVTFIQGGVILAFAVTHQVCDGPGCEVLFRTWSRHTNAISKGTASGTPVSIPEHNILRAKGEPVSQAEWEKIGERFPTFKARDGPPAPPPADFKMPTVKARVWHVSKSNLQKLKTLASAPLPAGSPHAGNSDINAPGGWVSTYDALLALLWRTIVRAKQPLLQPAPTAVSKAVHAVNARKRADPPMSDDYIGVAVTLPQSPHLTVADVLDAPLEATVPLLARTVRAATNLVTPSYVADLERWALSARDTRWVELDMHWVLGLDCMAFDWHTNKAYDEHDFGFGLPAALRWPHPQFEGFFFVLPTRSSKGNADEGYEIMLGLEESCYARFEKDEELLRYAEQRGTEV
ncbi:hypothetical protein VMCG_03518 [Cytospora schulzeri]|uniref:Trichothecene 3-O-acetyltransferase n=1 Tax=Cytospora schulzeri TaxID=448051 RepID=A0A423WWN3_9PEZI|nr:hypothetical protein VMCG_03518 [Valsa malicola]